MDGEEEQENMARIFENADAAFTRNFLAYPNDLPYGLFQLQRMMPVDPEVAAMRDAIIEQRAEDPEPGNDFTNEENTVLVDWYVRSRADFDKLSYFKKLGVATKWAECVNKKGTSERTGAQCIQQLHVLKQNAIEHKLNGTRPEHHEIWLRDLMRMGKGEKSKNRQKQTAKRKLFDPEQPSTSQEYKRHRSDVYSDDCDSHQEFANEVEIEGDAKDASNDGVGPMERMKYALGPQNRSWAEIFQEFDSDISSDSDSSPASDLGLGDQYQEMDMDIEDENENDDQKEYDAAVDSARKKDRDASSDVDVVGSADSDTDLSDVDDLDEAVNRVWENGHPWNDIEWPDDEHFEPMGLPDFMNFRPAPLNFAPFPMPEAQDVPRFDVADFATRAGPELQQLRNQINDLDRSFEEYEQELNQMFRMVHANAPYEAWQGTPENPN